MTVKVDFLRNDKGFFPVIFIQFEQTPEQFEKFFAIENPILFSLKNYGEYGAGYDTISSVGSEVAGRLDVGSEVVARGRLEAPEGSCFEIQDSWSLVYRNTYQVEREIKMVKKGKSEGFRNSLLLSTVLTAGVEFRDFEYLVPGAFYKYNDIDHDGIEDWLGTYNQSYRDDRLPMRAVIGYYLPKKFYISLFRVDIPKYDQDINLYRKAGERELIFDTDIGSIGFCPTSKRKSPQVIFRAHYPFYEGERSFSLSRDGYGWGSFLPSKEGYTIKISYGFKINEASSLIDAFWDVHKYFCTLDKPTPAKLPFTLYEALEYEAEGLRCCYREWDKTYDSKEPAGFYAYYDPKVGKNIANILDYDTVTSKGMGCAYASLRYGYKKKNNDYLDMGRKAIQFFVNNCQLDNGWLHSFYNVDTKSFVYWWSGVMIPCQFTKDPKELADYIGLKATRDLLPIIRKREKVKGNWLINMCDSANYLLKSYAVEKSHGVIHKDWLKVALKFGNFLLSRQGSDGSWNLAYTVEGNEVDRKTLWLKSDREAKAHTDMAIPFLCELYKCTREDRFLRASIKAGEFFLANYIKPLEVPGLTIDQPFHRCLVIDECGFAAALEAMMDLYEITGEKKFLEGAIIAGKLYVSCMFMWDIPFWEDTKVKRANWKSTGACTCDQVDAGSYLVHFSMTVIRDLLKLTELTGDETFFTFAKLQVFGMLQMVATPHDMHGYKYVGTRCEGYMGSWLMIDDKEEGGKLGFSGGTSKAKGEETDSFYPHLVANPIISFFRVMDEYETLDFDKIYRKIWQRAVKKACQII